MLKNSGIPNVVLAASIEFFLCGEDEMGSDKDSTVSGLRSKMQQR
jgi:hypothetical protein